MIDEDVFFDRALDRSRRDASAMLRELRRVGSRLVATSSSSERALEPAYLAGLATQFFEHVEAVDDASEALALAHDLGDPVLVTGSLYLVGDLAQAEARARGQGETGAAWRS